MMKKRRSWVLLTELRGRIPSHKWHKNILQDDNSTSRSTHFPITFHSPTKTESSYVEVGDRGYKICFLSMKPPSPEQHRRLWFRSAVHYPNDKVENRVKTWPTRNCSWQWYNVTRWKGMEKGDESLENSYCTRTVWKVRGLAAAEEGITAQQRCTVTSPRTFQTALVVAPPS
jgi:hypothetical protein